jgi:phosphoserine phosphatase
MDLEKKEVNKLAVFDLDGTLYKCNSHIELLNKYYGLKVFDCIIAKLFGLVFKTTYLKLLNYFYNRIPNNIKDDFTPEFRISAIQILNAKRENGYEIIIVSNAPSELIRSAAKRLNVDWLRADINRKNEVVSTKYRYNQLFVCTDNTSDMNLLDMANERVIYVSKRTRELFTFKYPGAIIMEV